MHDSKQARLVLKGDRARRRLVYGAQILAKTVGVTYGPHGRIVLLDRQAGLLATKDGVTVAREIELDDQVANLGCQVLKEACIKVNDDAGDGTTSTAIIAAAILKDGARALTSGVDPGQMVSGIRDAAADACDVILDLVRPVEEQEILERVAMIASNGDEEISRHMAEACMAVGKDGTLSIEDGHGVGIELVFKDGMEIDRGPAQVFLGTDTERVIEGALVAVVGAALRTVEDVQVLMEVASQWPQNPLVVFAEDIEGDALKMLAMNDQNDVLKCIAIPAPGFHTRKKDYLKDIAALAGADYIDPEIGGKHQAWEADWFGSLRKVTARAKESVLIAYDEAAETIEKRVAEIRAEGHLCTSEYDRDRCNERIGKLTGGLCVMQVGGYTEAAMKERRARIEDALGAVRAALEGGVVPGAGTAYLVASRYLHVIDRAKRLINVSEDYRVGWRIMERALQRPLAVLAENSGKPGAAHVHKVTEARKNDMGDWAGWDAREDKIRDLGSSPAIVDPAPVVRAVIETAVSAASTLLTVETSLSTVR